MVLHERRKAEMAAGDVPFPPMKRARTKQREPWELNDAQIAALLRADVFSFSYVTDCTELPKAAGVYFLIVDKQIVYVGQSWRLDLRWRRHTHREQLQKPHARIAFAIVEGNALFRTQVETFFIKRFKPPLNKCAP